MDNFLLFATPTHYVLNSRDNAHFIVAIELDFTYNILIAQIVLLILKKPHSSNFYGTLSNDFFKFVKQVLNFVPLLWPSSLHIAIYFMLLYHTLFHKNIRSIRLVSGAYFFVFDFDYSVDQRVSAIFTAIRYLSVLY